MLNEVQLSFSFLRYVATQGRVSCDRRDNGVGKYSWLLVESDVTTSRTRRWNPSFAATGAQEPSEHPHRSPRTISKAYADTPSEDSDFR